MMRKYKYGMFFLLALVLELSLFNYKFYLTFHNEEYIPHYEVGSGLMPLGDGRFLILEKGEYTITLPDLMREVQSLRLDIGYSTERKIAQKSPEREKDIIKGYENKKLYVSIEAQDKANSLGFTLGKRDIVHEVPQTTYMITHLSGLSEWVRYDLAASAGEILTIYEIVVNPRIPFDFSIIRVAALGAIMSLLYLLRPSSRAYHAMCRDTIVHELVIWVCILAEILLFARVILLNPYFVYPRWAHHNQYYELAEAFHEGQLYLKKEPPEFLKKIDNPYDTDLRNKMASELEESVGWDYAYFNGRYYVYFGVVPELLFYYPYYELAGNVDENGEFQGGILPHITVIFLCAAMEVIAVYLLLREIVRLWYRRTPFVLYLFLAAMFSMGCGILTILLHADFYSVPIVCGMMFSLFGLFFWLSAKRRRKEEGKLSAGRLFLGSLCMALVAGCRPQMVIMSFLSIFLFWDEIKERRLLRWKQGSCFVLPYLVVAVGLMYYNYARFGSPVDFGANYNLTTNDMTARGMELGRIGLGVFTYLFQPVNVEAVFPFLVRSSFSSTYLGKTIWENTYGGVFAANLILWPLFLLPWLKRYNKDACSRRISVFSFVFSVVVIVADTQMAGILPRYYSDFTWMLYLAVCPLLFSLYEYCLTSDEKFPMHLYRCFLMVSCLEGIVFHVLRMYAGGTSTLVIGNPVAFYTMAHRIAFWR